MRDPRTFYEFLLRKKVEANKKIKLAGKKVKEASDWQVHDAHQELNSKHSEFYLVLEILDAYRDFKSQGKEN